MRHTHLFRLHSFSLSLMIILLMFSDNTIAQQVMSTSLVDHKKQGDSLSYVHLSTGEPLSGAYKFMQSEDSYELAHFKSGSLDGAYQKYRYGKRVVEGVFKANRKDKTWRYYSLPFSENDEVYLEREEHYDEGIPHGEWIRYKANAATDYKSAPVEKVRYHKGQADLRETYDETGWLSSSCTYQNNVEHGQYTEFYPDGQPMTEVEYRFGQKTGVTTAYHANGQVSQKGQYDDEGKATGKWESWFEDGTLAGWTHYKGGKQSGDFAFYHPGGAIREKGTYNDSGNMGYVGRYQRFYENGQQAEECRYDNKGRKQGPANSWYENGNPKRETIYRDGVVTQVDKRYFENGQLEELTTYSGKERVRDEFGEQEDFVKSGPYKRYDEEGNLLEEGTYDQNRREGEWKSYYQGKLRRVQHFNGGLEEGPFESYYNGRIREKGNYKIVTDEYGRRSSKKDGLWTEYYYEEGYPSGLKMWEVRWQQGVKHGKSVRYNTEGKVTITEVYDRGRRQ